MHRVSADVLNDLAPSGKLRVAINYGNPVRDETSVAAIDVFAAEGLEAAVREHPGWRVIPGRFTAIEQAMGTLTGRQAGQRYLIDFIRELKTSGFVAAALQRHGKMDAVVAP